MSNGSSLGRLMLWTRSILREPAVLRSLVVVVVLFFFGVAAFAGLYYYAARLADNFEWVEKVQVERESRLVEQVFAAAKENRFITARRDSSGRLLITAPPCEELMLKRTADDDQKRRLLALLCNSPQGEEIRDEINEWNSSFDFLAVRDNRSQDDHCERSEVTAKIFVPPGCKPNKWKVDRVLGTGTASAAWMLGAEPPPDQFGEVVTDPEDLTERAGDWGRVSGDPNRDPNAPARYRLTTSITLPPSGDIVIDVVGRLREVQIDDKIRSINPTQLEIDKTVVLGPAQMTVSLTCEDEDEEEENAQPTAEGEEDEDGPETPEMSECTAEPIATAQRAIAYQIVIAQAPARVRPRAPLAIELTLQAEALENLPQSLETGKDSRDRKIRRTRHLVADCKTGWIRARRGCDVSWTRIEGSETQQQHANYRIVLGDGKAPNDDIVDPKTGFIDQRAFDLGLAPLVGFGPQEWGSLGSTLAARSRAQSVQQPQRSRRNSCSACRAPDASADHRPARAADSPQCAQGDAAVL